MDQSKSVMQINLESSYVLEQVMIPKGVLLCSMFLRNIHLIEVTLTVCLVHRISMTYCLRAILY